MSHKSKSVITFDTYPISVAVWEKSSLPHQRLVNEATTHGTDEVLRRMPVEYSPELEFAVRQGVRQAILYYADRLDSLSRRLRSLESGERRA